MKRIILSFLLLILSLICFAQNKSPLTININSFGTYDMNKKSYYIESCMDNLPTYDLEFKEFASYIDMVMATKGAVRCDDHKQADVVILMHFDITDESYMTSVPIPFFAYYQFSGSTYNYSYGITGYHSVTKKVDNYHSVINLYAYNNKKIETPEMLWKINISSEGDVYDYRIVFPYLAFSSISYIGKDTYSMVSESFDPNNYIYNLWVTGKLNNGVYYPKCKKKGTDKSLTVLLSEKNVNEILITIHEYYSPNWDRIWKPKKENSFLVVEEKEIACSELETIIDQGSIYSVFHFPILRVSDFNNVNLIIYKNSKRKKVEASWQGIEVKMQ